MPNIKSAKKRVEVSERNRATNKAYKSELATKLKKYNSAVSANDQELVEKLYPSTVSLIDESVTRGVIHKNKADRKKAEVSSKLIAVAKAKKTEAKAKKEEEKKEAKAEEVKAEVAEPKKTVAKAKAVKKEEVKAEKKPAAKKTKKAE